MAAAILKRCLMAARWLSSVIFPAPKRGWQRPRRDAADLRVK